MRQVSLSYSDLLLYFSSAYISWCYVYISCQKIFSLSLYLCISLCRFGRKNSFFSETFIIYVPLGCCAMYVDAALIIDLICGDLMLRILLPYGKIMKKEKKLYIQTTLPVYSSQMQKKKMRKDETQQHRYMNFFFFDCS